MWWQAAARADAASGSPCDSLPAAATGQTRSTVKAGAKVPLPSAAVPPLSLSLSLSFSPPLSLPPGAAPPPSLVPSRVRCSPSLSARVGQGDVGPVRRISEGKGASGTPDLEGFLEDYPHENPSRKLSFGDGAGGAGRGPGAGMYTPHLPSHARARTHPHINTYTPPAAPTHPACVRACERERERERERDTRTHARAHTCTHRHGAMRTFPLQPRSNTSRASISEASVSSQRLEMPACCGVPKSCPSCARRVPPADRKSCDSGLVWGLGFRV